MRNENELAEINLKKKTKYGLNQRRLKDLIDFQQTEE